ncbi:MAG: CaiB/BaiF CoA transferase family protein, partial [Alphaproteobacteria bacterium]
EGVNRNKRGFVLDLKADGAPAVIARLAEWADVAVEGFRPGVVDRLGVGYDALKAHNPAIIYCSLSGYGQTGPSRLVPGHDGNYLAASGALSFSGHLMGAPRRMGVPVADCAGGYMAVVTILAALAKRHATGEGAYLDVSLTEAALAMTAARGVEADPEARLHLFAENDLFACADGRQISMGIVEEHFWAAFIDAAGELEPRLRDAKFADTDTRRANGPELAALLAELFARQSSDAWLALFEGHDIPASRVLSPREAATSAQIAARGLAVEEDGRLHVPFPFLANGAPGARLRFSAPELGQHTDAILGELGFAAAEVAALKSDGTVGSGD